MKRFKSILCASLLTLAISSVAFAGDLSGRPVNGDLSGKPGDLSGKPGDLSGRPGDLSGKPGDLSGLEDVIIGLLSAILP